jgi:hypothetical protein
MGTRQDLDLRKKYPLEYRVFMVIETIAAKRRKPRVILGISPTE